MTEYPPPPLESSFKDRRTGLMVFGVLAIIIGGFCALFVPLTVVGQILARQREGGMGVGWRGIVPGALSYAAMAVLAITLGIGSIRARRWARALTLCVAWIMLIGGILDAIVLPFVLRPSMEAALAAQGRDLPPGAATIAVIVGLAFTVLFLVALPASFVIFYRLPDVKRTVDAHDPVRRWTDCVPLPVLTLCLLQCAACLSFLWFAAVGFPFMLFGAVTIGPICRLAWCAFAVFTALMMLGFYRLQRSAWTTFTVVMLVFACSNAVTMLLNPSAPAAMFTASGVPPQQLQGMLHMPWMRGHGIVWLVSVIPWAIYLLWVRRYFVPNRKPADLPSAP